ncbi:hypothetical protein DCS_06747 [Drechmeria coniospora]|uniref:Uncharacterized protein n=1 Tax=Drechmeria coniospora TaxID=98403 RepID=A0A151GCF1_DRECN|nr:hypothetical protein DCS_06747 [Drechmeria coniospora]KYK54787.1 hypothetical protein DCS_06747 [Drechmeria coniospora]
MPHRKVHVRTHHHRYCTHRSARHSLPLSRRKHRLSRRDGFPGNSSSEEPPRPRHDPPPSGHRPTLAASPCPSTATRQPANDAIHRRHIENRHPLELSRGPSLDRPSFPPRAHRETIDNLHRPVSTPTTAAMGQSFIHRIQAKLELFRLEKRYTQRRHRRSAFVSNAVYVDGEYIYQTPNSTGSYTDFNGNRIDALHGEKAVAVSAAKHTAIMAATPASTAIPASDSKRVHRFGEMPGIGDSFGSFGKDEQHVAEPRVRVTR